MNNCFEISIDDALNLFYVHSTFVIFKHTIVALYYSSAMPTPTLPFQVEVSVLFLHFLFLDNITV